MKIKPFHVFRKKDQFFAFNIYDNKSLKINEYLYNEFCRLKDGDLQLSPILNEAVKKLQLPVTGNNFLIEDDFICNKEYCHQQIYRSLLILFVVQDCNMECRYCYGSKGEFGSKGVAKEETAKKAIDLFFNTTKSKKVKIRFMGGEPLLNFELIKKLVNYANTEAARKNKELSYELTTNATLVTEEIILFFKEHKFNLLISLDGGPEVQNYNRPLKNGKDSFNEAVEKIKLIKKILGKVHGRASIGSNANVNDVLTVLKSLFDTVMIVPLVKTMYTNPSEADYYCGNYERVYKGLIKNFDIWLDAVKNRKREEIENEYKILNLKIIENLISPVSAVPFWKQRKYYHCLSGRSSFAVDINGDIYPCHIFVGNTQFKSGNVNDVRSVEFDNFTYSMLLKNEKCKECFARYYCGGSCWYENITCTGDFFDPFEEYCLAFRSCLEYSIYIANSLNEADIKYLYSSNILKKSMPL
ncbi:MAG: radical SAM protein [Candidatus Woesearchaeota archaeon]